MCISLVREIGGIVGRLNEHHAERHGITTDDLPGSG